MDKIVNFLLDYYVWILAVLGIAIVTVIGFLVDSKQKRKKKENLKTGENNAGEVKTVEPLPEEKNDSVVAVDATKSQEISTTVDNIIGGNGIYQQPVNNIPVTNEQTANFETNDVNVSIPQANQGIINNNGSTVVNPKPVNAVHINEQTPVQQNLLSGFIPIQPQKNAPMQNVNNNVNPSIAQGYNFPNQQVNNQINNVQPIQQPVITPQNNAYQFNQIPMQQSQQIVNQGPTQQMMNQNYNLNSQTMQQNNQFENNNPQNIINNQQANVGMNFGTGQQNNGDNWNL